MLVKICAHHFFQLYILFILLEYIIYTKDTFKIYYSTFAISKIRILPEWYSESQEFAWWVTWNLIIYAERIFDDQCAKIYFHCSTNM